MKTITAMVAVILVATAAEAQWTTGAAGAIYYNGGKVGIGTTTPSHDLQIDRSGADAAFALRVTSGNTAFAYGRFAIPATANVNNTQAGFIFQQGLGDFTPSNRLWNFGFNPVTDVFQVLGGDAATARLTIKANGFVGINTSNPGALLDVNGDINVVGNIAAKYQDFAEWVPSTEQLEPGTVVVLNPSKSNEVMASTQPYDSMVAGVVSVKPGVILGEAADNKEQIATSGRVRIRVDATTNPIRIGDLLVTGEKPGVAMKSMPVEVGGVKMHRPGTIVGKALEPLEKGEGQILVLLSLQ